MVVTEEDIADVVSNWTGIPVRQLTETESHRLLHLEEELHKRVISQNEAVEAVAKAVRRARAGLKDVKRPIGSFLFLGPSGVGKTELARTLARQLFGSDEAMIRIDMSEYMAKIKTRYVCSSCGSVTSRWMGKMSAMRGMEYDAGGTNRSGNQP